MRSYVQEEVMGSFDPVECLDIDPEVITAVAPLRPGGSWEDYYQDSVARQELYLRGQKRFNQMIKDRKPPRHRKK